MPPTGAKGSTGDRTLATFRARSRSSAARNPLALDRSHCLAPRGRQSASREFVLMQTPKPHPARRSAAGTGLRFIHARPPRRWPKNNDFSRISAAGGGPRGHQLPEAAGVNGVQVRTVCHAAPAHRRRIDHCGAPRCRVHTPFTPTGWLQGVDSSISIRIIDARRAGRRSPSDCLSGWPVCGHLFVKRHPIPCIAPPSS